MEGKNHMIFGLIQLLWIIPLGIYLHAGYYLAIYLFFNIFWGFFGGYMPDIDIKFSIGLHRNFLTHTPIIPAAAYILFWLIFKNYIPECMYIVDLIFCGFYLQWGTHMLADTFTYSADRSCSKNTQKGENKRFTFTYNNLKFFKHYALHSRATSCAIYIITWFALWYMFMYVNLFIWRMV